MSEPFVGEIECFGFNFAPKGWALCQGQILPISQNTALFSLLGTYYGGNGTSTFALPNLQGNVLVGQGQGPGLSPYVIGQTGGSATVSLLSNQLAPHTHTLPVDGANGGISTPSASTVVGSLSSHSKNYAFANTSSGAMGANAVSPNTGGGQPHNNVAPYVTLNYCIALQGIYPSRN